MNVILILLLITIGIESSHDATFIITQDMSNQEIFKVYTSKAKFMIESTGDRINECIEKSFVRDANMTAKSIRQECIGEFNGILDQVYKKHIDIMHIAFLEVLEEELKPFKKEMENEIAFLYDNLKMIIDREFDIFETFKMIMFSLKYHVEPKNFMNIFEIVKEKLASFEDVYKELQTLKLELQKDVDIKLNKREKDMGKLLIKKGKK